MATVTHEDTLGSTTNAATYTSNSFTPALNDLIVVFAVVTDSATAVPTCSSTDGLAFTHILREDFDGIGVGPDSIHLFVATSLAAANAQTVTVDFGADAGTGCILHVAGISGMSRLGSQAVRQIKPASGDGDPVTVAFDSACLTGNPTLACIGLDSTTPPATISGWTRGGSANYSTPTASSAYEHRSSGFTGTDLTWGAGSVNDYGAMIVEFDTSAAPSGGESFELGAW